MEGETLCIKKPFNAQFEDCVGHILLNVASKRRKFLLNAVVMLRKVAGAWVLHTPVHLTQSPSETLALLRAHANTLYPGSEYMDDQIHTLYRQVRWLGWLCGFTLIWCACS